MSNKLVLFGAGKIGRSFIGQLFSRSGYEVVFIDIDEQIIAALNQHKRYEVIIKSDQVDQSIWVENVRGVLATNKEQVIHEIASADMMAMAVGQQAIPKITPLIAQGLARRDSMRPEAAMDIILAENLRDAAQFVKGELRRQLPETFDLDKKVGLIETSIGKMVPIMPQEVVKDDPLLVYAEPYNTLILNRDGFKNPIPDVAGLAPKHQMAAWVDRKAFIHNLGHAAAVYYGHLVYPNLIFLYELMEKDDVYQQTRDTMLQAADILMKHHAGVFSKEDLVDHIDDLLHRFSNKALGDTVFRVGQDLYRKLGPEDRLVAPLKLAVKFKLPFDKILYIMVCAVKFRATNEAGSRSVSDEQFSREAELGVSHILDHVCKLDKEVYAEIHKEIQNIQG